MSNTPHAPRRRPLLVGSIIAALAALAAWAHGPELWQSGPDRAHVDAARFEGARKLLREEIDGRTLSELGVRVQTAGGVFD